MPERPAPTIRTSRLSLIPSILTDIWEPDIAGLRAIVAADVLFAVRGAGNRPDTRSMSRAHLHGSVSLGVLVMGIVAAPSVSAQPAAGASAKQRIVVDRAKVVPVVTKAPIAHVPFPMVDPQTSKPVPPTQILVGPKGEKVSAQAYWDNVNKFEKYLNDRGLSQRTAAPVTKFEQLHEDDALVQGRLTKLAARQKPTTPAVAQFQAARHTPPSPAEIQRHIAVLAAQSAAVPYRQGAQMINPNRIVEKTVALSWPFDASIGGDFFGAEFGGEERIESHEFHRTVTNSAHAHGSVFGHTVSLLDAQVIAKSAYSDSYGGSGSAETDFTVTLEGVQPFAPVQTLSPKKAELYMDRKTVATHTWSPDFPSVSFGAGPFSVDITVMLAAHADVDAAYNVLYSSARADLIPASSLNVSVSASVSLAALENRGRGQDAPLRSSLRARQPGRARRAGSRGEARAHQLRHRQVRCAERDALGLREGRVGTVLAPVRHRHLLEARQPRRRAVPGDEPDHRAHAASASASAVAARRNESTGRECAGAAFDSRGDARPRASALMRRRAALAAALLLVTVGAFAALRVRGSTGAGASAGEAGAPSADGVVADASPDAAHRYVLGSELTYTLAYESDGTMDLAAEGAARLSSRFHARLVRTVVADADRGNHLVLYRFLDADVLVAINESNAAGAASEVATSLAEGVVAEESPDGHVVSLRTSPAASALALSFARTLLGALQVTLPARLAPTWNARETDTNGDYIATYAIVGDRAPANGALALKKTKRASRSSTSTSTSAEQGEWAALTRGESRTIGATEIDFDLQRGAMKELASEQTVESMLGALQVATTKTKLDAERTGERMLDAPALVALLASIAALRAAEPAPLNARSAVDLEATKTNASKHWLGTSTLPELVTALHASDGRAQDDRHFDLFLKLHAYTYLHPEECARVARLLAPLDPSRSSFQVLLAALGATGSREAQAALVTSLRAPATSVEAKKHVIATLGMLAVPGDDAEAALRSVRDESATTELAGTAALSLAIMAKSLAARSPKRANAIVDEALARAVADEHDEARLLLDLAVRQYRVAAHPARGAPVVACDVGAGPRTGHVRAAPRADRRGRGAIARGARWRRGSGAALAHRDRALVSRCERAQPPGATRACFGRSRCGRPRGAARQPVRDARALSGGARGARGPKARGPGREGEADRRRAARLGGARVGSYAPRSQFYGCFTSTSRNGRARATVASSDANPPWRHGVAGRGSDAVASSDDHVHDAGQARR